jgi:hypothetical protein
LTVAFASHLVGWVVYIGKAQKRTARFCVNEAGKESELYQAIREGCIDLYRNHGVKTVTLEIGAMYI